MGLTRTTEWRGACTNHRQRRTSHLSKKLKTRKSKSKSKQLQTKGNLTPTPTCYWRSIPIRSPLTDRLQGSIQDGKRLWTKKT